MMKDSPTASEQGDAPVSYHATPDALIVGHLTRDLTPDGGWRLGGPALYAARTATLRRLRVAIVTSAPADVAAAARSALPGVALRVAPARDATTFENIYEDGARRQFLRAVAEPLSLESIPPAWRAAPVALLAPVAREVDPAIGAVLRAATLGLAPQGWLRQWDEDGLVSPCPLDERAEGLLSVCAGLILSCEDLTGPHAGHDALARAAEVLRAWSARARNLVVTRGREGADLWREGRKEWFPAFPAHEVDPTGAGDVFAMTFVCALAAGSAPEAAMVEANQVAALSVEGVGIAAIPTPEAARERFARLARGG